MYVNQILVIWGLSALTSVLSGSEGVEKNTHGLLSRSAGGAKGMKKVETSGSSLRSSSVSSSKSSSDSTSSGSADKVYSGWRLLDNGTYIRVYDTQSAGHGDAGHGGAGHGGNGDQDPHDIGSVRQPDGTFIRKQSSWLSCSSSSGGCEQNLCVS